MFRRALMATALALTWSAASAQLLGVDRTVPTSGGGGGGVFSLIGSIEGSYADSNNGGVGAPTPNTTQTANLSTTGAKLLVVTYSGGSSISSIVSALGNLLTCLTPQTVSAGPGINEICYTLNPVTGLDKATATGTGLYANVTIAAYGDTGAGPTFDKQTGAVSGTSPAAPGSATPTNSNALVIAGIMGITSGGATVTTPTGYSLAASQGANGYAGGQAYQIQTTPSSTNPSWAITNVTSGMAATLAVFSP